MTAIGSPVDSPAESAASTSGMSLRRFLRNPLAVVGSVLLLLIIIMTVLGPIISPYDPAATDLSATRQPPSAEHWLGTDSTGRDVLTRLLYGGQVSLMVGFLSAIVAVTVGVLVGTIAAWFGGAVDSVLSRLIDIMLSLPGLLVMIVLAGIVGSSVPLLIFVIGGLSWPSSARIARGVVLSLRQQEFVQAARVLGSRTGYIIRRHLVPGVLPPVLVAATLLVAGSVMTESALSFLGAGVRPPQASWGNQLTEARSLTVISSMPWLWAPPGIMIALTVFSAMAIGDGLRDAIDPRRNS